MRRVSIEQPAAFRPRTITEVLRPATADEVVEIVRSGRRGLHPISTGYNWGLGSGLPVGDGATVLDLSGLDRVRALDLERGYAVVEPGVTQGALVELLRGTPRIFNLTTSSLRTSIIGNSLERGAGVHRARAEDLVGLEVVLADGRREHVGWWPGTSAVPRPHGLGPTLTHLFTQSSFAVVTAAVVRLLPRPEEVRVLPFTFAEDDLADAVDALRSWTEQRLIPLPPRSTTRSRRRRTATSRTSASAVRARWSRRSARFFSAWHGIRPWSRGRRRWTRWSARRTRVIPIRPTRGSSAGRWVVLPTGSTPSSGC